MRLKLGFEITCQLHVHNCAASVRTLTEYTDVAEKVGEPNHHAESDSVIESCVCCSYCSVVFPVEDIACVLFVHVCMQVVMLKMDPKRSSSFHLTFTGTHEKEVVFNASTIPERVSERERV